ncbi:hypothetical protein [Lactobacillus psittaci]|uniref:Aggregation promoting protein n=1 Tax=Lactobacillus psittaci DSM 15354 TaxID=1122152 RepID=A0A0R1RYD5_9LACO|nr:hypothetical protein [Lactobacillus psittaci]KRL61793.1 aggregation promoting protein [Lactobacillus psittaci DSM 15354]
MAVAAITTAGVFAANFKTTHAQAATLTQNDTDVVTINYVPGYGIALWDNPDNPQLKNDKKLQHATSWKVIQTAYDKNGNKWYDLGGGQWIEAKWTKPGYHTVNPYVAYNAQQVASSQAVSGGYSQAGASQQTTNNYNSYSNQSTSTTTSTSSYTSTATGSEAEAKAWIANKESGGSYTAQNGQYYGKYQLSLSYLNGDLSASNQEKVADNYVKTRYGSWTAAKAFWQANGWY